MNMESVIGLYQNAFKEHGDHPASVFWPKGRQDVRFDALTRFIPKGSTFSLLDYGCGLAALKPYMHEHHPSVTYSGADMVPEFVQTAQKKYDSDFYQVSSPADIKQDYDVIIGSGLFNPCYRPDDREENRRMVFDILQQLFNRTRVYLAIDFMTDAVDFQQENSYHQNVVDLYQFALKNLSPRLVIDQSYMPYEFSLIVWKDRTIQRPENLYAPIHQD